MKLDLKDAYFHLKLHPTLQKFVRLQVGGELWEFQGACFGLSTLPKIFMSIMHPLQKIWRSKGLMVYVYLDDIILLAPSEKEAKRGLSVLLETLCDAGFKISQKKSVFTPTQRINHLGFIVDFQKGQLEVPPQKLKTVRKELGKILLAKELTCRKITSVLGQIRSYLVALPFLRLVTQQLHAFSILQKSHGWDHLIKIPQSLKQEIKELKKYLDPNLGRKFLQTPKRFLHSDSSTWAWGGVDSSQKVFIQDYWRGEHTLHINAKELKAALQTIKSFAKKGESILLNIDNQVALSYLRKWGGKKEYLNNIMLELLDWCLERDISLQVQWVPSQEMVADRLTRWSKDPGDYTLDVKVFQQIVHFFSEKMTPEVDMFSSPGNAKFQKFCTRWPHHQSFLVDALKCDLAQLGQVYANPPWKVIQPWLVRLMMNRNVICLLVVTMWVSAPWWPLLIKMVQPKTKILVVQPRGGLFQNCWGELMPKPKWPLACLIVSGSFWNSRKWKSPPLTYI